MKLIGAGFGRTGTLSIKAALEELGVGPCYHMVEVFAHPEHAETWLAAAEGKTVNWTSFLAGYEATVDWPGCTFYQQLMAVYPDAKVLLNVRDPDRWYESAKNTIASPRDPGAASPGQSETVGRMISTIIWQNTFGNAFDDKERAIATFQRHNQEVQEFVPPERLLIYEVQQGWEPLCAFLDVPVPEGKSFPRLNDTESFRAQHRPDPTENNA